MFLRVTAIPSNSNLSSLLVRDDYKSLKSLKWLCHLLRVGWQVKTSLIAGQLWRRWTMVSSAWWQIGQVSFFSTFLLNRLCLVGRESEQAFQRKFHLLEDYHVPYRFSKVILTVFRRERACPFFTSLGNNFISTFNHKDSFRIGPKFAYPPHPFYLLGY